MADININPNLSTPDGDDDASRVEKKRQVEAQQRATADQRANAFKKTMNQLPNSPANPYAVQQQSKETGKPTKVEGEIVESLTPPDEPEGEPEIKSMPGATKRSNSPEGKPMGLMAKPSAGAAQSMARTSGPTDGSTPNSSVEGGGAAPSSVQANSEMGNTAEQNSIDAGSADAGGNESSGGESSSEDRRSNSDLTSRIDIASIAPSFPSPTTQGHAPVATTPPPAGVNIQMIEQMVQFAAVGKTKEGLSEFQLGIGAGPLAGLNICLTACGRRRVKLRFSGVVDTDTITDAQVNQLVNALQSREVEVVEVEIA